MARVTSGGPTWSQIDHQSSTVNTYILAFDAGGWNVTFTESKRDSGANIESEEAFQHSLAELSHQLAARRIPEPPEFPVGADDDDPTPAGRQRWRRPAILVALVIALLAGYFSFRGGPASPPSPAPTPPNEVRIVAPPPPTSPATPTTTDFAAAPTAPAEAKPEIAPPPPAEEQPPAQLAPLDRREVREVQMRLQALGMSPGPIDGVAGPLTQGAARRYEASKGRPESSNVDSALLQRLRSEGTR